VGLDQYVTSRCDGFVGQAIMLDDDIDITLSMIMDEPLSLT
jgi:hypothetical protein